MKRKQIRYKFVCLKTKRQTDWQIFFLSWQKRKVRKKMQFQTSLRLLDKSSSVLNKRIFSTNSKFIWTKHSFKYIVQLWNRYVKSTWSTFLRFFHTFYLGKKGAISYFWSNTFYFVCDKNKGFKRTSSES